MIRLASSTSVSGSEVLLHGMGFMISILSFSSLYLMASFRTGSSLSAILQLILDCLRFPFISVSSIPLTSSRCLVTSSVASVDSFSLFAAYCLASSVMNPDSIRTCAIFDSSSLFKVFNSFPNTLYLLSINLQHLDLLASFSKAKVIKKLIYKIKFV